MQETPLTWAFIWEESEHGIVLVAHFIETLIFYIKILDVPTSIDQSTNIRRTSYSYSKCNPNLFPVIAVYPETNPTGIFRSRYFSFDITLIFVKRAVRAYILSDGIFLLVNDVFEIYCRSKTIEFYRPFFQKRRSST
jgi:hypothetical protein